MLPQNQGLTAETPYLGSAEQSGMKSAAGLLGRWRGACLFICLHALRKGVNGGGGGDAPQTGVTVIYDFCSGARIGRFTERGVPDPGELTAGWEEQVKLAPFVTVRALPAHFTDH